MGDEENKMDESQSAGEETEETAPDAEQDLSVLKEELVKKEAEAKDLQDKYIRTLAEMDNFRKRMTRDQAETVKFANEKILCDLLTVMDNLDRAVKHASEKKDFDALLDGLNLTIREFNSILEKYGVKYIECVGQAFDPSLHHAVSMIESQDHEDNAVVEEFRKGYTLNERVLRPSMVSVARKKENSDS